MVLTCALIGAVFSSIIWMVYAVKFILSSLGDMSFFDAGLLNVLLYTLFVCLPVFVIWMIFGFVNQYANSKYLSRQMHKLFSQMKKNQEYSDLLARIMLDTGENIRNSFMMNHFELLISDMNELLCEIIQREKLITKEQVSELWVNVQNGGKGAFGKIFIESYNKSPNFKKKLFDDALSDNILSGTIMEFCARYQTLVGLLEKYDKEKSFLNIIETGIFGKAFFIVASVSDDLRRSRDAHSTENNNEKKQLEESKEQLVTQEFANNPDVVGFYKKDIPIMKSRKKDEFSLALERSFSSDTTEDTKKENIIEHKEPVFTLDTQDEVVNSEEIPDSQKALDDLKKQWNEIEQKQSEEDSLVYPFGGWTDAEKYQK